MIYTDLKYYLSGGSTNTDPSSSFGGEISSAEIGDNVNNLFGKVRDLKDGEQTYRCLYLINEGESVLDGVKIWTEQESKTSVVYLGVSYAIETQLLFIGGSPFGGYFTLTYTAVVEGMQISQTTLPINFTPTPHDMEVNIADALNALDLLSEVTVSADFVSGAWKYTIIFGGSYRKHLILEMDSDNIIGIGVFTDIIVKTGGQPINAVALSPDTETQSPNVAFVKTDADNYLSIGTLNPLDGFAVWMKRVVEADTEIEPDQIDTLTLKFSATTD